ncbi:hypothetical protein D3P08_23070 [Paenibacillus nanensis]|uniref:peptidylprolyl isomerase n=1 Tax=Paenibacillus nanensis TaxID=393251 RepID=A0A3A1UWE7_9BACL|nr:peptidyl-prolyl cis-trans isomerase [Paenibacillus nanensis]RIX49221.1 hypothetical protein D3P08_23070 [Paenibacillus nanensis]
MKRNEVLKAVVILQAVCMIALTGMVMVKVWPLPGLKSGDQENSGTPDIPVQEGSGTNSQAVVASVGGKTITMNELTDELLEQYGDAVLRVMMVRIAIDKEAEASGLTLTPDEIELELARSAEGYGSEEEYFKVMKEQLGMSETQIMDEIKYRLLMEKITVRDYPVTDDEIERYIDEHPEQFGSREQYHLKWIVTSTREQAESVLSMLEDGGDFAELASNYSIDAYSAENGGDLGLIEADDPFYDEAVLNAAAGLAVAEIAGPIELEEGYAVIELAGKKSTSGLTGDQLYQAVRRQLALERARPIRELEDELLTRYGAAIMK